MKTPVTQSCLEHYTSAYCKSAANTKTMISNTRKPAPLPFSQRK